MEEGTNVWLRTPKSEWGWVPAKIIKKVIFSATNENNKAASEDAQSNNNEGTIIELTLIEDFASLRSIEGEYLKNKLRATSGYGHQILGMLKSASNKAEPFNATIRIDTSWPELPDVKLRNMPASSLTSALFGILKKMNGHDPKGAMGEPSTLIHDGITGGMDDLIGLMHLHKPAILHALQLRYTADIIYTYTGPILLAINPFKPMDVYGENLMDLYRIKGEEKFIGRSAGSGGNGGSSNPTLPTNAHEKSPTNGKTKFNNMSILSSSSLSIPLTDMGKPILSLYLHHTNGELPPHIYQTADDAYHAMMRGIDMDKFVKQSTCKSLAKKESKFKMPTNQSILISEESGESGAGKTVTTKIILNYFTMLSWKLQEKDTGENQQRNDNGGASIKQQVLQSNPIVEAFGNACTMRNDNSSRFGKYIDIACTSEGKLLRASIDTYLLEKVLMILFAIAPSPMLPWTHPQGAMGEPSTLIHDGITGGMDDLIGLMHLHKPAILHALQLRYTADIIYTYTGPILLAINPFKPMDVYGENLMDLYRIKGEEKFIGRSAGSGGNGGSSNPTLPTNAHEKSPTNGKTKFNNMSILSSSSLSIPLTDMGKPILSLYLHHTNGELPPHVYQTMDNAYHAMMRGIDMDKFIKRSTRKRLAKKESKFEMPTNQSILISGESGESRAGKTITTKIVLNYFTMPSWKLQEKDTGKNQQRNDNGGASIEHQVLQSNPIVEAFGNACTMRNNNSSRFGKYIDIACTSKGKLLWALIDTYLLEKCPP
ncbi:hypothetical protein ACHAWX_007297 [Stephanocyclus meneghinianus]